MNKYTSLCASIIKRINMYTILNTNNNPNEQNIQNNNNKLIEHYDFL